jgi:hypothetical protein
MTEDEVRFCGLVNGLVAAKGYSVKDLRLEPGGATYEIRLKRLGDPEESVKRFVFFSEQLVNSIVVGRPPEGLQADIEKYLT